MIEQWQAVRHQFGNDVQPFFALPEATARGHFLDLAKKIHQRCTQDEKVVLPHMVKQLDRMEATLDQMRYLHALGTIPSGWQPNQFSEDKVIEAAVQVGVRRGFPICCALRYGNGDRTLALVFSKKEKFEQADGLMHITGEQVALWSSLDGEVLHSALGGAMFGIPLFAGVEANWNGMVTFIGRVARTLYPNSIHNGAFGISARHDLKTIGVPFPVGHPIVQTDKRVSMLRLTSLGLDAPLMPFLNFDEEHLQELVDTGEVETAGVVARWLFDEWGWPTGVS